MSNMSRNCTCGISTGCFCCLAISTRELHCLDLLGHVSLHSNGHVNNLVRELHCLEHNGHVSLHFNGHVNNLVQELHLPRTPWARVVALQRARQ